MKKYIFGIKDRSMSNHSIKAIIAVTMAFFSILLAGCGSVVHNIEAPTPLAAANQHLEELSPKLSKHYLQPMFMVEALDFTAVDETGWDWWGSDEIYSVWKSNAIVSTLIVDNVDSGDDPFPYHQLQSCIYPIAGNEIIIDGRYGGEGSGWICKGEGGPGPIQFTAFFLDDDSPAADLPLACFSGSFVTDCEDTFVGKYIGTWSNEELRAGWTAPGTVQDFTVRLIPYLEGPSIIVNNFPDYDFHFRITRMADKEILMVNAIE